MDLLFTPGLAPMTPPVVLEPERPEASEPAIPAALALPRNDAVATSVPPQSTQDLTPPPTARPPLGRLFDFLIRPASPMIPGRPVGED